MQTYNANLLCDPGQLASLDPARTAHICIDVQHHYFNPDRGVIPREREIEARAVALMIAKIAPRFNRAGLAQTFWVYHDGCDDDLFLVRPEPEDVLLAKPNFSAFSETDLHDSLQTRGIKNLFLTGGYTNCCVRQTALDALREKYNVFVLLDCVEDDSEPSIGYKRAFSAAVDAEKKTRRESFFTTSSDVLAHFGTRMVPA